MANQQEQSNTDSSVELAYASLVLWADDGSLDTNELDTLLNIALRDGVISEAEKEVLRGVFNRVHEEDVPGDVWDKIHDIRKQHSI